MALARLMSLWREDRRRKKERREGFGKGGCEIGSGGGVCM